MISISSLLTAPAMLVESSTLPIVLRGRFGSEDLILGAPQLVTSTGPQTLVMFGILAALLMTGALSIGLEMRTEARDRKA